MATKKIKYEFFGIGAIIQLIGLALLFFFPVGTVFGIMLLIYGSIKSKVYKCSECGIKLEKDVKICPNCKAQLNKDR